jgi:hypothetical protein
MQRKAEEKATKKANEKYELGEITKRDQEKYIKNMEKLLP